MQKNVAFPSGFLCTSLLKEKQKNSTVKPRLSGLIGTSVNSPDNRESG